MNSVRVLHEKAMDLSEQASRAGRNGDDASSLELYRKALELESKAAGIVNAKNGPEPTRSVLLRSAASLALLCREFRQAEQLIARGLAREPPAEIADELRDLLEQVYFERHLSLRGLELAPEELQLSLVGREVTGGMAEANVAFRRIQTTQRMLLRTAERISGYPFRESSEPSLRLREYLVPYLSSPRAACFAVTLRIGRPSRDRVRPLANVTNESEPVFATPRDVVNDFLECVGLFGAADTERLHDRIPDETYFRNFVENAKRLAPDAEGDISAVNFTAVRSNVERSVSLSSPPNEIWKAPPKRPQETRQTFVGVLKAADETGAKHKIRLRLSDGQHTPDISVPSGMMSDIVKPFWDETVRVRARKNGSNRFELIDIEHEPTAASS